MSPLRPQPGKTHAYTHDVHAHDQAYIHIGNIYHHRDAVAETRRVLDWLAPQPPSEDHNEALKQYEAGTLKWYFEDPRFTRWRDLKRIGAPNILWCQGPMGTGKTTLVAQVREYLHARKGSGNGLAVAYCRSSRRSVQTVESILGSIIAQLYERDEESYDLPECVMKAYRGQRWILPQISQLEEWLQARCKVEPPVFVLLDAIDELDILQIRKLLRILQSSNLKLLVTSRELSSLRQEFGFCTEIQIRATARDLQTMILARLERESTQESRRRVFAQPSRNHFFSSIEEEVIVKILESTNHMFLVATLHVNHILVCNSIDEVYHCLDTFSPGLDRLYDQAWERATRDSGSLRSQRAKLILMWVSVAPQPLSVATLVEALGASHGIYRDSTLLTEHEIVAACEGLVRIDHRTLSLSERHRSIKPVISLSHLSVQEYLDKNRKKYFPEADNTVLVSSLVHSDSRQLHMALSPLSGAYLYLTMLSFVLSAVYDHRHNDKRDWLAPEVIDFLFLLVYDVVVSARFKYLPAPNRAFSTLQRSVPVVSPTLRQYFHQNLRQHTANASTITKIRLCIRLLHSQWTTMVALGICSWISGYSQSIDTPEGSYRWSLFVVARLLFCALLGRKLLHDSAVSQRPSFHLCPIIVFNMLWRRPQITQDMESLTNLQAGSLHVLAVSLAPVCYQIQRVYALWMEARTNKDYHLPSFDDTSI